MAAQSLVNSLLLFQTSLQPPFAPLSSPLRPAFLPLAIVTPSLFLLFLDTLAVLCMPLTIF